MAFSVPVSTFEKLTVVLSVTFLVVYTVSFASPQWLYGDNVPLPYSLNLSLAMGLFRYCKEITGPDPSNPILMLFPSHCSSEGAEDWQYVAAGFAITALVLGVVMAAVNAALVFVPKVKGNRKLQCLQAATQFATVGAIMVVLILYAYNNSFKIPILLMNISRDLSWGYYLSVVAVPLGAIHMLCTIINLVLNLLKGAKKTDTPATVVSMSSIIS